MVRILACLSFLPVAAQVGGPYVPPPGSVVSTKVRLPRNIANAAGLWSANMPGSLVTVRLNADGTGTIVRGKDEPAIDTGRWAQSGSEVLFEFDSKPGRAALPSIRWTMRAGNLVPLDNTAYGSQGLPFKRQSVAEESHAEGGYKASDAEGRQFRLDIK